VKRKLVTNKEVKDSIRESYLNIQKYAETAYPEEKVMVESPLDEKVETKDPVHIETPVAQVIIENEEPAKVNEVDSIERSFHSLQRYTQIIKGSRELVNDI
jgi:hypothetical protein